MKKTITIDNSDAKLTQIILEWEKKGWKVETIQRIEELSKTQITFFKRRDIESEKRIIVFLTNFFPAKWVQEIHEVLRDARQLEIDNIETRVGRYLGCIALFLQSRNLTLSDSTLEQLNQLFRTKITKKVVTKYQEEVASLFPHLNSALRFQQMQTELVSLVLYILKNELILECSRTDLFHISHHAFLLAFTILSDYQELVQQNKDDLQTFARAICLQATHQVVLNASFPFPHLPDAERENIETRCLEIQTLNIPDHVN